MNTPAGREALFQLFGAFSEGTITETEASQLEEALGAEPESRRLWFLYQDMELGLDEWAASRSRETETELTSFLTRPASPPPVLRSVPAPRRLAPGASLPVKKRPVVRFATAAAWIAAAGIALWGLSAKSRGDGKLATLTRTHTAHWEHAPLAPGTPILSPHELDLASGIVELSMSSGALVVFEGPGRMEILSDNSVRLESGRLHATVPPAARGFTIEGGGYSIVDHGTEFGCFAPASGPAEVHVFDGDVEVAPVNREHRWLRKNQALAIQSASLESIAARPELFVSPADLDRRAADPAARSDQATRILKNHPAAIVHFDASNVRGTTLTNTAANAPVAASEITMHDCTLTDGRSSGRGAIQFDGTRSRLTLRTPCESTSFTLLAWVRTDVSSRRQDLVSGSGPLVAGEIAWYLYYYNAMGFGVHMPTLAKPSRGWRHLHSEIPSGYLNEWSFLTTVVDAGARTATHYLNGKIIGMGRISPPATLRLGPLIIGATTPDRNTRGRGFPFQGAIDELAIIASPLTPEEISRIHELGRSSF
jgi:hypothetical protein